MKSKVSLLLFVLVAFSAFTLALGGGEDDKTTVTGTLVDSACYSKGGFLTNDHGDMANCGTMCAKGGIPVAVVDKDKNVYLLAAPAPGYADYVGMQVRIVGTQGKHAKEAFIPEKLEVKEDGKWVEKKLPKTMM